MKFSRFNSGLVVFALIGGSALAVAGCSAAPGSTSDDDDGDGGSSTNGSNASSGSGFTGSNSSSGAGGCTDPSCIGGNPQGNCDMGLAIDSADPMDGARAMGLCKVAEGANSWGVITAEWVTAHGLPLTGALSRGKGILDNFGNVVVPREGANMLALSSGSARNPGDPEYFSPGGDNKDPSPHSLPPGYNVTESPACPGVTTGLPYDSASLRVTLKVPSDAKSLNFDFDFYTYEYPDYICSTYNDFFVAIMNPAPPGAVSGNISFDSDGNTISVNAGFMNACMPSMAGGKNFTCPSGYGEIVGTGFDDNIPFTVPISQGSAATSWLVTTAPVTPGSEITLLFSAWDSGDGVLDSTVLIDNFKFDVDETSTGTTPIPQ